MDWQIVSTRSEVRLDLAQIPPAENRSLVKASHPKINLEVYTIKIIIIEV